MNPTADQFAARPAYRDDGTEEYLVRRRRPKQERKPVNWFAVLFVLMWLGLGAAAAAYDLFGFPVLWHLVGWYGLSTVMVGVAAVRRMVG
jgi:hypothetical protein